MFSLLIAIIMCLAALLGLALVAPSVVYSWHIAPIYYNLARLALPLITLGYFVPNLFGLNFPGSNGLLTAAFLMALGLVALAIIIYLYREPGDSQRTDQTRSQYFERPAMNTGSLIVRTAQPEDLPGAGRIFAEAFHQSFDMDFGPDRQRNARLLGDLLKIKSREIEVAVLPETGQIVGAMWLDLGDKSIPAMSFSNSWPILRGYLNSLHAAYFSLFALPTIMERRGTAQLGYIQWLGTDPEWQGRQIGRNLVQRAVTLSQVAGKKEVVLHTERSNERARKLYSRAGFVDQSRFSFSPRIKYVKPLQD